MSRTLKRSTAARDGVRRYRARPRKRGPRPKQFRVPDTGEPGFAEAARRQSLAVASSRHAEIDQASIDSISEVDGG